MRVTCSAGSVRRDVRTLISACALGIVTLAGLVPVYAQNEISPAQQPLAIDWPAVARDMGEISSRLAAPPSDLIARMSADVDRELAAYAVGDKEALRPLAQLNRFMTALHPEPVTAPVPMLAPIDTARYLDDIGRAGQMVQAGMASYLAPAFTRLQLLGKSSGYDALLTVSPDFLRQNGVANADLVTVHIGATGVLYDLSPQGSARPPGTGSTPVEDAELRSLYPDIRRFAGAENVTYSFSKYGLTYFADITCDPAAPPVGNVVSCAQVDPILQTVVRDLRLIGGAPSALGRRAEGCGPARPAVVSSTFKFYPPGNLPDAISQDGLGGVTARICWAPDNFVFPLKTANAFANTQIFFHGGDCGGRANKIELPDGRYACRQMPGKALEAREAHPENYTYPWRDTYCEVRNDATRNLPDCPARTRAHEGQDIRPNACIDEGGRCKIDLFEVVAVTRGRALWTERNHVRLIAEDGTSLYYMYMHMSPQSLSNAGMRRGVWVPVEARQPIGKVGNWLALAANVTTAHLHFEIRSQTVECENGFGCPSAPYWTLVRAYEQLIEARGTEIAE